MHICIRECGYLKYQNPKINREGILIYGCVCVYALYSDPLKSYATRRMTNSQTRIWIPSLIKGFIRNETRKCHFNDYAEC